MIEVEFYQTRAGRTYYEKTLPELVDQMRGLAHAIVRLAGPETAKGSKGRPWSGHEVLNHPSS